MPCPDTFNARARFTLSHLIVWQSLSPGLVNTPLVEGVKNDAESGKYFRERAALEPKDIANAVLYVLGTPPSVLVTELTILPATQ